jgi:hypothetical protein
MVGAIMGLRTGWQLATRSMELMKRAREQRPELRTLCGQHDAYLDIAEEIERSTKLPPDHTLKRVASYARSQIARLGQQAECLGQDVADRLATSRGDPR